MLIQLLTFVSQYIKQDEHSVVLIDPADGNAIREDTTAAFVMQDDYYRKGIEFLRHYAPQCSMTVRFGTHSDIEAFGGLQAMRQAIMAHDVFIPENLYWDQQLLEDLNEVAARTDIAGLSDVEQYKYEGEYSNMLLLALAGTHVKVELVDMDETDLARSAQMHSFNDAWRAQRSAQGKADPHTLIVAMTVMNYYREWIMLAKLGYVLKAAISSQPDNADGSILLSIGALHYNLVKKMQALNVMCTVDHATVDGAVWQSILKRSQMMSAYEYTEADIQQMINLFG